jgi:hypothetical protein
MPSGICPNDSLQGISSLSVSVLPSIHTDNSSTMSRAHLRRSITHMLADSEMKLRYDSRHGLTVNCGPLVVTCRPTSMPVTVGDLLRLACQILNVARLLVS